MTNNKIIKLIVLDALGQQGKTWEEFKRKIPRTSRGKQTVTSGGSQAEVETQTQPTGVRIGKKPIDEPIGDRRLKQRVKFNIPAKPFPTVKKQTEAEVLEGERRPSSSGKDETNPLCLEIEKLRKEKEELKQKLSKGKEIPVSVCMTCF